jgi:hypothetical protein
VPCISVQVEQLQREIAVEATAIPADVGIDDAKLAKQGLFCTPGHHSHLYALSTTINAHHVRVLVNMSAARGGGFGGAFDNWAVTVDMDGRRRLQSAFGHVHYLDITVSRLQIFPAAGKGGKIFFTAQDEDTGVVHVNELVGDSGEIPTEREIKAMFLDADPTLPSQNEPDRPR